MPIGINALPNIKIIGKCFTISSNYLLTAFTYKKYCNCLHTQITMLLPMPFIGTSHNSVVGKAMQSEHSVFSLPIIALMKNPSAVYL